MKHLAIVGLLGLTCCAPIATPSDPVWPIERLSSRLDIQSKKLEPFSSMFFETSGFSVQQPTPFALVDVHVCEASQIVLGDQLGLPFVCEGDARLSVASKHSDPVKLLNLFALGVQSVGGRLVRSERGFSVIASAGRGAAFSGDDAPPEAESVLSSVGYTVSTFEPDDIDRLSSATLKPEQVKIAYFASTVTVDDLLNISRILGLDVNVTTIGRNLAAIGKPSDVSLLEAASFSGTEFFASVPVPGVTSDDLELFQTFYPELKFFVDTQNDLVSARGLPEIVASFVHETRSRVSKVGNSSFRAGIYSVDNQALDKLTSSFSLNFGSDGSLILGDSVAPDFLFELDKLVSKSKAVSVAEPMLTVSSGETGSFSSGVSVSVVAGIDEEGRQAYEYIDTGTITRLSPVVRPSGMVSVGLQLEISTPVQSDNGNPNIVSNQLSTSVDLRAGDTVILGGLDFKSDQVSNSKRLFMPARHKQSDHRRILIVLTLEKVF